MLSELFEVQARRTPEAVALVAGAETVTYGALERCANRLARHLIVLGVGPETRVGLHLERSADLVAAILAIHKAGGSYLPLEPSYPTDRLAYLLADSQAEVVITTSRLQSRLPAGREIQRHLIDQDRDSLARYSAASPVRMADAECAAYLIYTSGSTGRPKGVLVSHRAVCNHMRWMQDRFPLTPSDRVLQKTSFSFDASVWEIFAPLMAGATLVLAAPEGNADPGYLTEILQREEITVVQVVPSFLRVLVEHPRLRSCRALRHWFCGGEALPAELVERVQRELAIPVHNLYGPTEAAIDATCATLPPGYGGALVPIGRPVANVQAYVLDPQLEPVPPGDSGELFLGGEGLARGYWGDPEKTAARFLPDPFSGIQGGRLYRTGDLVRHLTGGDLLFVGRIDGQVKVRGFRIEPGEVEEALGRHPGVRQAVVAVQGDASTDGRLVAYVVPREGELPSVRDLRAHLAERLPAHLIPGVFLLIDGLPLTASGKVDRRALATLNVSLAALPGPEAPAYRTTTEEILKEIWAGLLNVEGFGSAETFLELGGDSLLLARVASRIRGAFGVEIGLRDLFGHSTVQEMACVVDRARRQPGAGHGPPLLALPREAARPLSLPQQRLWAFGEIYPGVGVHHVPVAYLVQGQLDLSALAWSLCEIVKRHEVLRTRIVQGEGEPRQEVAGIRPLPLPVLDLSQVPAAERRSVGDGWIRELAGQPFDLAAGPLLRGVILRLHDHEHILLLVIHHVAVDGWSIGVIHHELSRLFESSTRSAPPPLANLPLQYADFAAWQRSWLQGEVLERRLSYWKERLAGAPTALDLPSDRPYPKVRTFRGRTLPWRVPRQTRAGVQHLCRQEGASLFMLLLTCFLALLHRYTARDDLIVGAAVAGRNRRELEGLVGLFVNLVPLRSEASGNPSLRGLLARVRETALAAFDHQDFPFEELAREMASGPPSGRPPLFQVTFAAQNTPHERLSLPPLAVAPLPIEDAWSEFELSVTVEDRGDALVGRLQYSTDLFDAATILRLGEQLHEIVRSAVGSPDQAVLELEICSEAARHHLLREWNDRATPAAEACLHHDFEAQAERSPDAAALLFGDHTLTYGALDERANQLARFLQRSGVEVEDRVGIHLARGLDMVVAVLGVLKAGGAYVPLDVSYPSERLALMASDAQLEVVLVQESPPSSGFNMEGPRRVAMDRDWPRIAREDRGNPHAPASPHNLAYVIYTSGSTGRPKGVLVPHRGVSNLAREWRSHLDLGVGSRALQFASLSFDVSAQDIFVCLLSGAVLCLEPQESLLPGEDLARVLREREVTWATLFPAILGVIPDGDFPQLRSLTTGADIVTADLVKRWRRQCKVFNAYGPTETSISSTIHECEAGERKPSIGRPVANTWIYLVDRNGRTAPAGVAGEIWIGGIGVSRGYGGRPDLTAERFVPDPFGAEPGGRLYRTGDLARYLGNGEIDFLGRIDHQVKIRGFRIEPQEVETILAEHPAVHHSVVIVREDLPTGRGLVAYVVPVAWGAVSVSALREFLQARVPGYLMPVAFTILDTLPLTVTGKLDKRALPRPELEGAGEGAGTPPSTPVEKLMAALWSELLHVPHIGRHDDFFELGGHSLVAIQLIRRVRAQFQAELAFSDLIESSRLAALAAKVEAASRPSAGGPELRHGDRGRENGPVALRPGGSRPPLFCVLGLLKFSKLAPHLPADQPCYGLPAPEAGKGKERCTVEDLARGYVQQIRELQPQGPYSLIGWCQGGIVAFEIARQIHALGDRVASLILLDAPIPKLADGGGGFPAAGWRGVRHVARRIGFHGRNLQGLDLREKASYLGDRLQSIKQYYAKSRLNLLKFELRRRLAGDQVLAFHDAGALVNDAACRYLASPFSGGLTLILAREMPAAEARETQAVWARLSDTGLETYDVPGDHATMFEEPHVRSLAEALTGCLARERALPARSSTVIRTSRFRR